MSNISIKNRPAPPAGSLGTTQLYLIAMGTVIGSGLITLIGPSIAMTGYSVWLAFIVAIILGFLTMVPKLIVSSTLRVAGGDYSLCSDLASPMAAGIISYVYLIRAMALGQYAIALRSYLGDMFPALDTVWTGVALLTIFYVINMFGVNAFAKTASIMCWILLAALLLFIGFGVPQIQQPLFDVGGENFFTGGFWGFFQAVFLLISPAQGYAAVLFYGTNAKRATRDIPKVMWLCLATVFVLYVGVSIVMVGVLPLEESAGKTMTVVSNVIMPKAAAMLFFICGPVMALTTTLNGTITSLSFPLRQCSRDGWLPKSFAAENKNGVPWKIYTYEYLVALIPLLLGFNITLVTNNVQLILSFVNIFSIYACSKMIKKYPEAWAKSKYHMSKPLFMTLIYVAILIYLITIVKSLLNFTAAVAIGNILAIAATVVLGVVVSKKGNVQIETSVWTDNGAGSED